jgi:hypothetical protein
MFGEQGGLARVLAREEHVGKASRVVYNDSLQLAIPAERGIDVFLTRLLRQVAHYYAPLGEG